MFVVWVVRIYTFACVIAVAVAAAAAARSSSAITNPVAQRPTPEGGQGGLRHSESEVGRPEHTQGCVLYSRPTL